jgi:hypothetical protein
MRMRRACLIPMLAATGATAAIALAPSAQAAPKCTNTTPTTTQCERPGNAQINTSPGNYGYYNGPFPEFPWYPWGFGPGITIGLGGL